MTSNEESKIEWVTDKKHGNRYRVLLDGVEYIRSSRGKNPSKRAQRRPATIAEKQERALYMKKYRRVQAAKIMALQRKVAEMTVASTVDADGAVKMQ